MLNDKNIIVYGFGITGKWLSSEIKAKFIVDTDIKKWGDTFGGIEVKSPDALKTLNPNTDIVVVTVVDIFDVLPLLDHYGVKWISLAELLSNGYEISKNITSESNDFLRYSIDTVLSCQRAYLKKSSFYLRSVDLVITEKCTLKCKDCANLMQFYEMPENYSSKDILDGIIGLSERADFIHEVRVIGGEPFLNKEIYEIIHRIALIDNIHKIVIYTNGMIPPKEEEIKNFNKNKILFSITDYAELGRNLDKTVLILDKYSLPYRVHPPEHWTDSGKILEKPWTTLEAKDLFAKCCGKNLYTLIGEDLYRCPFAANADKLRAIPKHASNSINVLSSVGDIKDFAYGIDYIDACKLCPGRSFDSPIIKPAVQVKKSIVYRKFPIVLTEG
jgi:hypothetical protein